MSRTKSKPRYKVGQVVSDLGDGTYLHIVDIQKSGSIWVEWSRGGTRQKIDPEAVRPLTKKERG